MLCENMEKVECIGNWIRLGLITLSIEGRNGIVLDTAIDVDVDRDVDDELDWITNLFGEKHGFVLK